MRIASIRTGAPFPVAEITWAELIYDDLSDTDLDDHLLLQSREEKDLQVDLSPELKGAGRRRRRDWLAGRICAMHALNSLGVADHSGLREIHARWPTGILGSISHDRRRAIAVASDCGRRIGVDCETSLNSATARLLAGHILSPQDEAMRPTHLSWESYLTLVFSAKEAAFKSLPAEWQCGTLMKDYRVMACEDQRLRLSGPAGERMVWWHHAPLGVTTLATADIPD
ncbi:4'-phosphopantetheinyl transferase family protein [Paracoccus seriniphilus]|uniref:Enterobactin synthase component D n=1 Tax=Paracoccus seriniphilus TaxID=184748 RepID=A0A239Q235_9RHOB|nr:4'-phosphopantetheinyl transferase superfamily protein [Paracoccus seriniphilus]WCR15872.1 4'-phosphopantetheinyl transferase superfamily protein [Paracoccus seriniphilus]SNT76293.1 4'-phosphopantetheinyl transferase superfamily protein [Paracoccus seriniphilus]